MTANRARLPAGHSRHDRVLFRVHGRGGPWRVGRRHGVARAVREADASVECPVVVEVIFVGGEAESEWIRWIEAGLNGVGRIQAVVSIVEGHPVALSSDR